MYIDDYHQITCEFGKHGKSIKSFGINLMIYENWFNWMRNKVKLWSI